MEKKHIFIFIFLFFFTKSFSQGPNAPEAGSFESIDASDMVQLLTGDFTYVLPLINVPGVEGGYPVNLAYHAGISVGQESSWVGLGWNINPGAINRYPSGVPDDWKDVRTYSSIFNAGGIQEKISVSLSAGWAKTMSIGAYANTASHRSVGGEFSSTTNMGISGELFGITGRAGTDGYGIGAQYGPLMGEIGNKGLTVGVGYGDFSFAVNKSFIDGSTTTSASLSVGPGTGASLSSNGGLNASLLGFSVRNQGQNLSQGLNLSWGTIGYILQTGYINIGYTEERLKYWVYENEYKVNNGPLYPEELSNIFDNTPVTNKIHFDAYESDLNIEKSKITKTNFSAPNYDSYVVSGQGIGGSITPHIFEQGVMPMGYNTLAEKENHSQQSYMGYFYPKNSQQFSKKINNDILSKQIHFNFDNEIASYLKVKSDNWNVPVLNGTYSDIFNFQPQNRILNDIFIKNGISYDGYSQTNARLRRGNFVEVFTNKEIKQNPNLVIEPANFNRNSSEIPEDGIGAYKITTLDGKTYHYSLPVYQKESFSKSIPLNVNDNEVFQESFQLTPYATHWLLVGITGPDYIDINDNKVLDQADYGYWVNFDYGKWSDGYVWRSPASGYINTKRNKNYEWGRKEIYYLDKIITPTHTALFIKSIRHDNKSAEINYRQGTDPLVYTDNHHQVFDLGTDDKRYLVGTLCPFEVESPQAFQGQTKSKFFVETHAQRSLKLDKIILLKNNSLSVNISKINSNQSGPINMGKIKIDAEAKFYNVNLQYIVGYDQFQPIHHVENWQGEFFGNVLDNGDLINTPQIQNEAVKTIEFNYSHSLVPQSPNSSVLTGGKLTLDNVAFVGKNNISLLPPYSFNYTIPSQPYNPNEVDDWGYSSWSPKCWSLSNILTPTGGEIAINYETDNFYQEAAPSSFLFDSKFEMKFTGTEGGAKYVQFRNDSNNISEEDINFLNYFTVGEQSRVNVQFVWDPDHNGGERVADIDKFCLVTNLTSNTVTLQLPSASSQSHERNDLSCFEDNWVYYNWYNEVVSETNDWVGEENEGSCSEVGDNSRRIKIKFYSSKIYTNQEGGGVRVKDIKISDGEGNHMQTSYEYKNPFTSNSSGIVSYAPSRMITKDVKHITHLPSPTVMYEYVTVKHDVMNMEYSTKNVYRFNVLKPMSLNGLEFNMGNELSLYVTQDQSTNITYNNAEAIVKQSRFQLTDKLSNIGRLESLEIYNSSGQLLKKAENYYEDYIEQLQQGVIQETFDSYKKIWDRESWSPDIYCLSSSSKITYPSILRQTKNYENSFVFDTYFNDIDFLTGQVLETQSNRSDGIAIKTKTIPAYYIPEYSYSTNGYGMGAKVDDITNKNMLSQSAVNYTFLDVVGGWKPIGVGITTWSNQWSYRDYKGLEVVPIDSRLKIWRKYQTYIWGGDIDVFGVYINYDVPTYDGFDWGADIQSAPWKRVSKVERYNRYSTPIELSDLNNNFASAKIGDNDSKVIATSNARYTEMYFSGAEYRYGSGPYYFDGEVSGAYRSEDRSHTGKYSVKLSTGQSGFSVVMKGTSPPQIEHRSGDYIVSVWANKEGYQNARININGSLSSFNGEMTIAGNWVQMNHHFNIPNTTEDFEISLSSSSGTIYFDDFRILPLGSTMTSYVYNEFDELSFILGTNNLGTKYQYDEAGRLIRIYEETADTPIIAGGFKLAKEYRYNYKRDSGGYDPPNPGPVYFDDILLNIGPLPSTARLYGDPGTLVMFTLSIDCFNPSNNSGTADFMIDNVTYNLLDCEDEITTTVVQIPEDGFVICSIQFNNIQGPPDNRAFMKLTGTNPPFLIDEEHDEFYDESSFTIDPGDD